MNRLNPPNERKLRVRDRDSADAPAARSLGEGHADRAAPAQPTRACKLQMFSAADYVECLCSVGDVELTPRTAVIVAHPDDEVIGLGSRLPRLREALFVHVTDGAPLDGHDAAVNGFLSVRDYAQARRNELQSALSLGGIRAGQMRELGFVDQETAPQMAELARRMLALLRICQIEVVITHPYEGGHPDHDTTSFAVHAARWLIERQAGTGPAVIEMTSYHNSPQGLEAAAFLPTADYNGELQVSLAPEQRAFKSRLMNCYATQQETLQYFPIDRERFRPAPHYDFTRPPHDGRLFYEQFPWGMTGPRFCELAREAMRELHVYGRL